MAHPARKGKIVARGALCYTFNAFQPTIIGWLVGA